jgi:hypothetical protein
MKFKKKFKPVKTFFKNCLFSLKIKPALFISKIPFNIILIRLNLTVLIAFFDKLPFYLRGIFFYFYKNYPNCVRFTEIIKLKIKISKFMVTREIKMLT